MFDDFCPSVVNQQSRRRFRRSIAVAVVLYGGSSAAIVAATNKVQQVIEEKLTQVEFAPPPPPEPPPPPPVQAAPPPPSSPRPKVKRIDLAPPVELSKEKLDESNKDLAEAGPSGPVDGFLDGVEGGTGKAAAPPPPPPPPPPPTPEPLQPAVESASNEKPKYSASARRKGIEGTVVVVFDVLENGTVVNPQIVSGPQELHETVLRTALSWHFRPASRGGKPVRFRIKKSVVFRLEDA